MCSDQQLYAIIKEKKLLLVNPLTSFNAKRSTCGLAEIHKGLKIKNKKRKRFSQNVIISYHMET